MLGARTHSTLKDALCRPSARTFQESSAAGHRVASGSSSFGPGPALSCSAFCSRSAARRADLRRRAWLRGRAPHPRVFLGHTRFATTSVAEFSGTHPHQWTPPRRFEVWQGVGVGGTFRRAQRTVEVFV